MKEKRRKKRKLILSLVGDEDTICVEFSSWDHLSDERSRGWFLKKKKVKSVRKEKREKRKEKREKRKKARL